MAGGPILVVALIGVAVNIVAAWILAKANRSSLNVEGAYQHILTDLYGSIGTVIAGIVILTSGFTRADSIASLVIDDSCFNNGHAPQLLDELQACLTGDFDVEHSTFQLEPLSHAAHEPGTH